MTFWQRVVAAAFAVFASHALAASTPGVARAPERLADTGLYIAGRPDAIDPRNRPFSPQYPLWSDGAAKSRWIYLPPGSAIDASNADEWIFPVGTRLWKEFRFNGRRIETRLLWRASSDQWVTASYVWNDGGTDAVLAPDAGVPDVVEVAPGRRHSIPSATDCLACHGSRKTAPLGFNALQLSTDRDPNAIHGEALTPEMITLRTLVDERLIAPSRRDLITDPPRIRTANPRTRAVLGYLAANCGSCHDGSGEIAGFGPSLKAGDLLVNGDAIARSLVGHASRWQVPRTPEGASVLIDPAAPELSALLVRMQSRRPSSQMPPLGTVMRDQAAIDAITRWITADVAR